MLRSFGLAVETDADVSASMRTVAHDRDCDLTGIEAHRTRRRHDVITVRGIPVTTRARTILDCAAVMAPEPFRAMVESAVTAGLVAAGMPNDTAVPAVFLFRLGTFWLPILPGYVAFRWMQREDYL